MSGRGTSRVRWRAAAAAAVLVGLWAGIADAQVWLQNRRFDEGPGIRLGQSLVLHVGGGVEGGYDSNYFHREENEPGAGRLRVSAQLDLATRPPQRTEEEGRPAERPTVDFRLGVAAGYNEYFSDLTAITSQRNVALDAGLNLHLFPGRTFQLILNDAFTRTIQPQNEIGPRNFDRDHNVARLTFQYSPGGGMFELQFGYAFAFNYYEDPGDIQLLGNYTSHETFVNARWRFLPKTALVFTGSFTPMFRPDGTTAAGLRANDSYHARGAIGIAGLLTNRFSLLAQVGYGGGWYAGDGAGYDNVVARAELGFHLTPTARIALGYHRDFFDSVVADYYGRDRAYLGYHHLIAGRVMLSLRGGFSYIDYSPDPILGERADPMADAQLFVEYRIRDWIAVNVTLEYLGNFTSYQVGTPDGGLDAGNFQRFLGLAGVRAMY